MLVIEVTKDFEFYDDDDSLSQKDYYENLDVSRDSAKEAKMTPAAGTGEG